MARLELKSSGVLFKEDIHQYFREADGKELNGITSVISRQLFPHEYDSIPHYIVKRAADYGHAVHKSIESFDAAWENDGTVELQDYIDICKEYGLQHEASEYLISDGENYASAIDKVFRTGEDSFAICELKTYYGKLSGEKLERCRWQLSVYRALFMKMNKRAKVDSLFVIHLRNKQKKDGSFDHIKELVYVDPIPEDICLELLACDLRGEQFRNPFAIPVEITAQLTRMKELILLKNQVEEELNALKANILSSMEFLDVKNWATNDVRLTRKLPSIRSSFDLKAFKVGHPEITDYDQYMKSSNIAGSLTVSVA